MAQVHIEEEPKEYHFIMDDSPQSELDIDSWENDYKFEVDIEANIEYNAYIKNELEKNYPIYYVVVHSLFLFILNVTLIIFQIIAIKENAAFSELGLPFWVGGYNLLTVVLAMMTSKYFRILF